MTQEFIPSSALVICAHPDDIEFGASGTIAKWTKRGCKAAYVLVTSGNGGTHDPAYTRETIAVLREQEQRNAAAVCGVTDVEFLHYNDGEVMPTLELRKDLVRMIRKYKPEIVISMDPTRMYVGDGYITPPDHRAVATATMDAVAPVAAMPLMYPELGEAHRVREVWVVFTQEPNTWVDISETLETKMDALRQHKSQVSEDTVMELRKWAFEDGRGLIAAESFKVMTLEKRSVKAEGEKPATSN